MARVFFSYSHQDEELRNELETHLAALKRQGIIETWHDRRIGAGEDFENEISENLKNADIILLLVSSDFIASEYCYGVEMSLAMERHRSGEAHVVPVILRPCLWQGLPFGRLQATPTDGKPVTKFPNRDDAFLEVTKAIHAAAEKLSASQGRGEQGATESASMGPSRYPDSGTPRSKIKPDIRSGNLRVRKQFTDHEKAEFLDEAFEYIANYFEGSLAELEERNPEIKTRFKRTDANHFTSAIYTNGNLASSCRIWTGGRYFSNGIAYSVSERGDDSSMNESLSVDDDSYMLFLRPMGTFIRDPSEQKLTYEGGAECYWNKLIEPLQR
jgi:TIR domain